MIIKRHISLLILMIIVTGLANAQIKVGGNVYGGGNQGDVNGSTRVNVYSGDIGTADPNRTEELANPQGMVFGGARMANVGGNSMVNIDGKNASGYIIINKVYGGNDISGTIGTAEAVGEPLPTELAGNKDGVDNTFNSYVNITSKKKPGKEDVYYTQSECDTYNSANGLTAGQDGFKTVNDIKTPAEVADDDPKIYIGQLFAGGNGAYEFETKTTKASPETIYNIYQKPRHAGDEPIATNTTGFTKPEIKKTYLNVEGGSIVYAYGGGNDATVSEKTIIHVNNPSKVVNHIFVNPTTNIEDPTGTEDNYVDRGLTDLLSVHRFHEMGINTVPIIGAKPSSDEFQIGRFFGGNNHAEMAIRPTWNLRSGLVRNLYSGGNQGNMTSPEGLLVDIPFYSSIVIDNLYGGCRMADVRPSVNGVYTPVTNLPGYNFPDELSARILVRGGDINNVYGGNDVTGMVYGGSAVGIRHTIRGNAYGGGNGSYPYTSNSELEGDITYGDYYYPMEKPDGSGSYQTAIEALNAYRPNAEQVSIRLAGQSAENPTIIMGSVFVGGNCATLTPIKENPLIELKIGSHVLANNVFLGNNGEEMITPDILDYYANPQFNSYKFAEDKGLFADYMEGVAMTVMPDIVFDKTSIGDPADYIDNSSKIGSFYCGGNVGGMAIAGKQTYSFDRKLVVFNKLVGGCNRANVAAQENLNAAYEGGVLGSSDERTSYKDETGKIKDRIDINLNNVTFLPQRWDDVFVPLTADDLVGGKLKADTTYYATNLRSSAFVADGSEEVDLSSTDKIYKLTKKGKVLEWNTAIWNVDEDDFMSTGTDDTAKDDDRRVLQCNVYGGCYESGHVNGNVTININEDVIVKDDIFPETEPKSEGSEDLKIKGDRKCGVIFDYQRDDVMAVAMTVFGAGYGEDTEVWGSTTVNHNTGYCFQVFGGGEQGVVGKKKRDTHDNPVVVDGHYVYEFNQAYSTYVNLQGSTAVYSSDDAAENLAEAEYLYGGGNEGDVCGNSYVKLGNGRIYDAFGGASNADILGATEVIIGYNGGFPWMRDNVYAGNDFGGTIRGSINHASETSRTSAVEDMALMESSTFVKYIQGRVDTIFGGNYGSYNYSDRIYKEYTDNDGNPKTGFNFPRLDDNSFVFFQPVENSRNSVGTIFGGSDGYPGNYKLNNIMQDEAYVLIDDINTKQSARFANTDVYGGGSNAGVGFITQSGVAHYGAGRTVVDLFAGKFNNIYGGCCREGLVGYSHVNVPFGSTAKVNALFGGGRGYTTAEIEERKERATRFCDHYVTCVDYQSDKAIVEDAIYGGNQNCRISCDTYLNIAAPVMQSSGYQATIYGAGYGNETVCARTNIFMNNTSNAYKVFGGGRDGNVFNYASLVNWMGGRYTYANNGVALASADLLAKLGAYRTILDDFKQYLVDNPITLPAKTGTYVNSSGAYDGTYTNDILPAADDAYHKTTYYNTNVHIMSGGNVSGYAYGGGFGSEAIVSGTTYIELKGGNVDKDIYGGGQGGHVMDEFNLGDSYFTPSSNVYIEGGMARNVYGGGYLGHVGYHDGDVTASISDDRLAVANVTIGKKGATSFASGVPAITRNAYGGGEGGSVYGTANVTVNNGYIGYRYKNTGTEESPTYEYVQELDDQKPGDLDLSGNVFGGGYVINSYVDIANIDIYGGTVRGSVYGGGEIGPIGRGTMKTGTFTGGIKNGDATIFKAGQTHVNMYNGHVMRNVFGGGRGKDSWGGDGTMYMDKTLLPTLDMQSKGFIFGQTDVNIHGGEIGTEEGMARNFGNVFGGGDEGSVYSAYELNGNLYVGKKPTGSLRYDDADEGYYYKSNGTSFVDDAGVALVGSAEKHLTEDCHVLVEPWLEVTTQGTINYKGKDYTKGDYIPTGYLNTLGKKDKNLGVWPSEWSYVDTGSGDNERGVIIHNAVFAGGNIAYGSEMYANTTTVFGNATATIHDVYNRDLVTIGTGHTGGLYGDGNLTLVDGYRELNITNYGTDYFNIKEEITYDNYLLLPPRERAYSELKYKCKKACTDDDGTRYTEGSTIPQDELQTLFAKQPEMFIDGGKPNPEYWTENGVVSRYAGRIMNTIQRADFCGIFGSRMVMKGAQDRVPETVDYTNYTINRVREVSLNKKHFTGTASLGEFGTHGNYFGIYSVVNFLGALTSDVDFHEAVRVTDNTDVTTYQCDAGDGGEAYGTATYFDWKSAFHNDIRRNNGISHNELALASGVYLEITSEKSIGKGLYDKDWGLITGVVQLDLINVKQGIGGGFVYAKNVHGKRELSGKNNTLLSDLNLNTNDTYGNTRAVTNRIYRYDDTQADANVQKAWETSGNFVHNTQKIIDDCYNIGSRYEIGKNPVPAHYWFIRGQVYVYDQYISAYTGSPNAYSEVVEIPITITAASHNKMQLLDVQPSLYAYYSSYNSETHKGNKLGDGQKLVINDVTYTLNQPISYWDWYLLPASEKNLFAAETYITTADCEVGTGALKETIPAGYVMLPDEYTRLKTLAAVKDLTPTDDTDPDVKSVVVDSKDVAFDEIFHLSNNMSHDTGYMLTYKMTNPGIWDTWYTQVNSTVTLDDENNLISYPSKNQTGGSGYEDGPTYRLKQSSGGQVLGQREYSIGDIIPEKVHQDYEKLGTTIINGLEDQAEWDSAYVVTKEYTSTTDHFYPGAAVSKTKGTDISGYAEQAYVCTSTIQLSNTEYIYVNNLMTAGERQEYINRFKTTNSALANEIENSIVPALYCKTAGSFGGQYYEAGKNYRAMDAFASMSPEDRDKFTYNYDAFDLLIDPTYSKTVSHKYQYDGYPDFDPVHATKDEKDRMIYSTVKPIDYTATYNSDSPLDLGNEITVKRGESTIPTSTIQKGDELTRDVFESLPNERHHYAPIDVEPVAGTDGKYHAYVVKTSNFIHDGIPYAYGQVLDKEVVDDLSNDVKTANVADFAFTADQMKKEEDNVVQTTFYFCRDPYKINKNNYNGVDGYYGQVTSILNVGVGTTYTWETEGGVVEGVIITAQDYEKLANLQKNFTIHGLSPMETSTLYVTRNSDIDDLSKEKIITVMYQYDYEESDESGLHFTPYSERHIVNIHITFKSGAPTIEDIRQPDIVLPGTSITMRVPTVTPGAYEVLGGGWELFETKPQAEGHYNGVDYTPSVDSLYWFQDGFYLAYYAKTYLGKTYSNHVPVSVANYHDLKSLMDDKTKHLHVDYDRNRLKRDSKIYINDYSGSSQNGLDLLKDLYDLSLISKGDVTTNDEGIITAGSKFIGHHLLNNSTVTAQNIYDGSTNIVGARAAENLEFFLRTDIERETVANPDYDSSDPTSPATIFKPWTPIGNSSDCFKGNFHGDGHTLSGLDHSLFGKLCGSVYNLGVMGTFNSAGVADEGDGYVESCWVKTTAKDALSTKPYAVFGNPGDSENHLVVNSYFYDGNKNLFNTVTKSDGTITSGTAKNLAIAKSAEAFYNGELAYDLNNFYLYKRYYDHETGDGTEYNYYKADVTDPVTGKLIPQVSKYSSNPEYCSTGFGSLKYVENRFADGDFRYAAGEIPETEDERYYTWKVDEGTPQETEKSSFFPIYPDDYIFFGQKLTYGWAPEAHQDVPTAVARTSGRLATNTTANRVYRAPAYFRNSTMSVFHFNPNAYLAAKSMDGTKDAYPYMTAIDFAGHKNTNIVNGTYGLGSTAASSDIPKLFYPPLLDDDGLLSISNCDETRNLLVYAPAAISESGYANQKTFDVLTEYFTEPDYNDSYDNSDGYRIVKECTQDVHGHLVQSDLTAINDHLLVDKQDFNCPIGYTFTGDKLMWYQRTPANDEFVDHTKGWQGVSLPFTAELVTTNQKGEITHFYSGSETSKNGTSTKVGHEYWLRRLDNIKEEGTAPDIVAKADFFYPIAGKENKTVTNKFLWDYYYHNEDVHNQKDANADIYLQYRQYYNEDRTYAGYPLVTAATPYILGLPGETYYEFDLSGNFEAMNTAEPIDKLGKQIITFASEPNASIKVSDVEINEIRSTVTKSGYTFMPSYLNMSLDAGTNNYTLAEDGSKYEKVPATGEATTVCAFRPFFTVASSSVKKQLPSYILFSGEYGSPEEGPESVIDGGIEIYARGRTIYTRSHLQEPAVIRIINIGGGTITSYVLEPEQTVTTQIHVAGAYLVNRKKLFIR